MKNNKAPALWSQASHTLQVIEGQEPSKQTLQTLHNGILVDVIRAIELGKLTRRQQIRDVFQIGPVYLTDNITMTSPVRLSVQHGRSVLKMILAGRYSEPTKYVYVNAIPVSGRTGIEEVEAALFGFEEVTETREVESFILGFDKQRPWRLAITEETLAYGEMFPNDQKDEEIVGLGSSYEEKSTRLDLVLMLGCHNGRRKLYQEPKTNRWLQGTRFLAVRPIC